MILTADRVLCFRLGGGVLADVVPCCHGYSTGCDCEHCLKRDELFEETGSSVQRPADPPQPWEVRAA